MVACLVFPAHRKGQIDLSFFLRSYIASARASASASVITRVNNEPSFRIQNDHQIFAM
jgi:hypothetical protein